MRAGKDPKPIQPRPFPSSAKATAGVLDPLQAPVALSILPCSASNPEPPVLSSGAWEQPGAVVSGTGEDWVWLSQDNIIPLQTLCCTSLLLPSSLFLAFTNLADFLCVFFWGVWDCAAVPGLTLDCRCADPCLHPPNPWIPLIHAEGNELLLFYLLWSLLSSHCASQPELSPGRSWGCDSCRIPDWFGLEGP